MRGEEKIYDSQVMMRGGKASIAISAGTTKFRGGYHCNGGGRLRSFSTHRAYNSKLLIYIQSITFK